MIIFVIFYFYLGTAKYIGLEITYESKLINLFLRCIERIYRGIKDFFEKERNQKKYKKAINNNKKLIRNKKEKKNFILLNKNFNVHCLVDEGTVQQITLNDKNVFINDKKSKFFIESLNKFKNLNLLRLSSVEINNMNFLDNLDKLKNLFTLDLSNNYIEDIITLNILKSLRSLNLSNNNIKRIENLDNFQELSELNLSSNKISKIENLESLKYLKIINLSENFIEKIENLDKLFDLQNLYLSKNKISEIPLLNSNFNLLLLDLSDNQYISEIQNLNVLKKLHYFNISGNEVEEIKGLEENVQLRNLNLAKNKISNISNLEHLKNLESIDLSNNNITEIEGLGITSLRTYVFDNNPLSEEEKIVSKWSPVDFIRYNIDKKIKKEKEKISKDITKTDENIEKKIEKAKLKTINYDFLFIIPINDEFRVFKEIFQIKQEYNYEGSIYYELVVPNSQYIGIAILLNEAGLDKAIQLTQKFLDHFTFQAVILIGIAGSLDNSLKIGDIVVPSEITDFQADSKAIPRKGKSFAFEYSGTHWNVDFEIKECVIHFEFADNGKLYEKWKEELNEYYQGLNFNESEKELVNTFPKYEVGHIVSSKTVVASEEYKKEIRELDRKFLAIEMESAGIARVAHERPNPIKSVVIRGISDFADERKGQLDNSKKGIYRKYAMYSAIKFFLYFIKYKCVQDILAIKKDK